MAGDTSLWPIVVGGLLTGLFALGGIGVGLLGAARRDAAQERREAKKRRADKFEALVAAVYEYDHWIYRGGLQEAKSEGISEKTTDPFAKVQSISAVYFPEFGKSIDELWETSAKFRKLIDKAGQARREKDFESAHGGGRSVEYADQFTKAVEEMRKAGETYVKSRHILITALQDFARKEFR